MPIKTTSPNTGSRFWFSPGPNTLNHRRLNLTLLAAATIAFLFVLIVYAWSGGNPFNRIGYGLFVSVLPLLSSLLFLRLTKLPVSWQGAATIYLVLFFLVVVVQSFGRMIPVYN